MQTIEDRLRELLDAKDAEIERLRDELNEANEKADVNWKWFAPDEMKDDPSPGLPVPRLEILFTEVEHDSRGYTIYIRYDLIRRHLCDQIVRTPLGGTHTTGSLDKRLRDGRIDLPFRDGAHIMHDAAHLQLPAFAILGEHVENLSAAAVDYSSQTKRGKEHRRG